MASISRFLLCFIIIILLSFCISLESRPLETLLPRKRSTPMETAQEILRKRLLQRKDAFKYHINRLSPDGPDPRHH
ncbi:hypothetical protein R3W88_032926 [Solanum pinnatisectum]|uniref:Uncharacterized protein n=1 Tax=Solanum pinnatisectum TaxID=50273 RepID=A0AAV9LSI7_9SOLN|nr:hypothetical protein R3W88_032926 [Solanum pinnatisectum]